MFIVVVNVTNFGISWDILKGLNGRQQNSNLDLFLTFYILVIIKNNLYALHDIYIWSHKNTGLK